MKIEGYVVCALFNSGTANEYWDLDLDCKNVIQDEQEALAEMNELIKSGHEPDEVKVLALVDPTELKDAV